MRGEPRQPNPGLSELEHELMDVIWKLGPATAEQIREALSPRRPLKDSTVRTILRRLHTKGYVKYRIKGKAFVYSGTEKPANVAVRAVRQVLDRFCGGSLEQLLLGLVENEIVNSDELQELARKVAETPATKKLPKGG
jgi:BlaI family transcriptional regulator, penicillinase repressor